MGYRSDVRCVIYGASDRLAAFLMAQRLGDGIPSLVEDRSTRYIDVQRGEIIEVFDFVGENLKWYEGYPDVDGAENFFNAATDFEGLEVEFVRVGENDDDIERWQSDDCLWVLYVERSITSDLAPATAEELRDVRHKLLKEGNTDGQS